MPARRDGTIILLFLTLFLSGCVNGPASPGDEEDLDIPATGQYDYAASFTTQGETLSLEGEMNITRATFARIDGLWDVTGFPSTTFIGVRNASDEYEISATFELQVTGTAVHRVAVAGARDELSCTLVEPEGTCTITR